MLNIRAQLRVFQNSCKEVLDKVTGLSIADLFIDGSLVTLRLKRLNRLWQLLLFAHKLTQVVGDWCLLLR